MTFVVLDDKASCKGIYQNGIVSFDQLPSNLDRTWKYLPILKDRQIEYAQLYCEGKDLLDVCHESFKLEWEAYNKQLEAFLNSFKNSKINLDEHCVYDLIPSQFLLEYCDLKCRIIDGIFETYKKPINYDFSFELEKVLYDIKCRKLNLDTSVLNKFRYEEKVRTFLKNVQNWTPYIDFNQFGTKTGRLTTKKGTFSILNLNSDYRSIIKPSNDFFLEIDFNAAELRALIFLAGQQQPIGDLHEHNAKRLGLSREQAKKDAFAWLYGSTQVDSSKFDSVFNTKEVLDKCFDGSKVVNYFGREIESDAFHALNYAVQSATSDMVQRQVIKVAKFLEDKKSKIGFIVHDSLLIDMANSESGMCNQLVDIFGDCEFGLWPVRVCVGKNYGALKEVKK